MEPAGDGPTGDRGLWKSEDPYTSARYWAAPMTPGEAERITVPLAAASERLRATLEEHGAAIVTDVVPDDELLELEAEFFQDLLDLVDEEALEAASEEAREAYERFLDLGPRGFPAEAAARISAAAGFLVRRCISQGRFAWRVRRLPGVRAVFGALHLGAAELVASMDVTFFTPDGDPPAESNVFSAHCDQNERDVRPGLAEWESYQGIVYVWPSASDGGSSTTVVWPGSHRGAWGEMMKDSALRALGEQGFHYSEVKGMADAEAARRLARGWAEEARRAVVPAGAMFLWNSRTVHTGWRGGPRLAQAVCMEPAQRRPARERVAKLRLAALGLPSTHWASAGMQHDIVLGDAGYCAAWPPEEGTEPPEEGLAHAEAATAGLPLRVAIRPVGLADGADLAQLAKLVRVDYHLTGMWEPTEGSAGLLEASVREEIKRYL